MKTIAGLLVAGLMLTAGSVIAQNQNGLRQGQGYGRPPQSEEERAARQAACLEKNGGICPNGGPRQDSPRLGMGQGKRHGKRNGVCDGTGPKGSGYARGARGARR